MSYGKQVACIEQTINSQGGVTDGFSLNLLVANAAYGAAGFCFGFFLLGKILSQPNAKIERGIDVQDAQFEQIGEIGD